MGRGNPERRKGISGDREHGVVSDSWFGTRFVVQRSRHRISSLFQLSSSLLSIFGDKQLLAEKSIATGAVRTTTRTATCDKINSQSGPCKLPFLGSLLSVNYHNPLNTFAKWAEKFGKIYYVELGLRRIVVLSDYTLIRETLAKPELAMRPLMASFDFLGKRQGLAISNGELWQESRKASLRSLRKLGMGRSSLETVISEQVAGFIKHVLEPNAHQATDIERKLNVAIVNIIWYIVSSECLDICDESTLKAVGVIEDLMTNDVKILRLVDNFPFFMNILPTWLFDGDRVDKKFADFLQALFKPAIDKHKQLLDTSSEPSNYIEALLQEQVKRPDLYTEYHILMCMSNLFFAGHDTTATTLRWAFCFLCNEPITMVKIQEEIDAVTGGSRIVSLSDRQNMPYTEAFLLETQRRADIGPIALPHAPSTTVNIAGYDVPAGVTVLVNLRGVHWNADNFPKPHRFSPERFLSDDGRFICDKKVIPFSTGKRQCIGEALARDEMFLFLTQILQKFSFRWPKGFRHPLTEEVRAGIIMNPTHFELIPIPRNV